MSRCAPLLLVSVVLACASLGCNKEPACKAGKLDPAWESASLAALVPKDATVCEGSTSTTAQFWKPVRVHDANMASVGSAQDNGWSRNSDNWYATSGNFDTPKWSELKGAAGTLRIDVKEAGGGSMIDLKLTPTTTGSALPKK